MALIEAVVRRFEIPHEPGEWMEFRRLALVERRARKLLSLYPLVSPPSEVATADEREGWEARRLDLAWAWVKAALVGWSYATPYTEAEVERLDEKTLVWACLKAFTLSEGLETPDEKKADSPDSTPISTGTPAPAVPTPGS